MKPFTDATKECLQFEPPFCTVACPFHLDVRDFITKIERGAYNAAYRSYANAVAFPGIVSALCPQPCRLDCPRKDRGGAIALRALEQAVMTQARNLDPNAYNLPPKGKSVAIVGAGISGLAAALRLAGKGYAVTVFEKTCRIGGHLHQLLPEAEFMADIQRAFKFVTYDLRLNTEIQSLDGLDFDAFYLATGSQGNHFGIEHDPGGAFAGNRPGVFLGGSLCGSDTTMKALADGLSVCNAIERYLKVGSMNQPEETFSTRLKMNLDLIVPQPEVNPADGKVYSAEEAVSESKRCLKCACDACFKACDLMNYFKKFPKRIAEEVEITVTPGTLDGNGTVATRLISTCSQCGLCKNVCPVGIDMGELLLQGHRRMREKGAMPWAFHDFFLKDMAFANEEAGLAKLPSGFDRARYLFFPGCQLGASDPRYVEESYRFLLKHWPDTALMLGCCGAPGEWAGDEALRQEAMDRICQTWKDVGQPELLFACATCKKLMEQYHPEIPGRFIYELLLEQNIQPPLTSPQTISVFDPCASRDEPGLQQTIRALAEKLGFTLEALPMEGRYAQCCSWGGQVSIAHPPFARSMVKNKVTASSHPYIAYCSNCRDIFASAGKPAWHILDLLFGLQGSNRKPPTLSDRRRNRLVLKKALLAEYWSDSEKVGIPIMPLQMSQELERKLNDQQILDSEILQVIEHCEASGCKVLDADTGNFHGHLKIGCMTFWAEYRPVPGGFEVINAYGHRMQIEE